MIPPARATPSDVTDTQEQLSVRFTNGDRVVFTRSGGRYQHVGMTIAGKSYTLDLAGCQPFGPVVIDTLSLSPDDESRAAGAFTLSFNAGSDRDVRLGELPRLQISFWQGEASQLLITRRTSGQASFSDRLCSWRMAHEKAAMRAEARYKETLTRGAELSTSELLERFRTTDMFWRQREIGDLLVPRRDPAVKRGLLPMLEAEDRHVRANAAYVLARQGDPRGLDTLFAILEDRSARACGQGVPTGPCTSERQQLADRYYAAHVLGELRDPRAISVLATLTGDPEVGYKVRWALSQIGTAEAVGPLVRALDDPSPAARVFAIELLRKLQAREAIPKLRSMQSDPERSNLDGQRTVGKAAQAAVAELERLP